MMSDNDIRKGFQSKFSSFEAPVPPDGWESVERSLKAATAARTALRRKWYAGSVAAVLILLVGSILFIQNPLDQTGMIVPEMGSTTPSTVNTPDPVREMAAEPKSLLGSVTQPVETDHLTAMNSSGKEKNKKIAAIRSSAPSGIIASWMERQKNNRPGMERKLDSNLLRRLATSLEKDVEQGDKDMRKEETILVGGDEEILFDRSEFSEREEGTLLLAFSGRGGLTGYQQTVNTPMTLRSMSVAPDNKYLADANQKLQLQSNSIAQNVSEIEHDQPVSFGITVSKYILDDLSVETGLVYSYLHSKTRNANNNFKVEEVQKLHYLGIPVNVNYNVFSLNKLNVYTSIGGMVEKDVYGEFQKVKEGQTANFNNVAEESGEMEIKKISQNNPQISVNAGVGLSYPVYDRLRLYGKVGGAYYFDAKNQYKTIYSDRKIVMDLNVGLRYEF